MYAHAKVSKLCSGLNVIPTVILSAKVDLSILPVTMWLIGICILKTAWKLRDGADHEYVVYSWNTNSCNSGYQSRDVCVNQENLARANRDQYEITRVSPLTIV